MQSEIYIHSNEIHNLKAPREVVPIIVDLVKPGSVLDVGCGTGTWLKVFEENNVVDFIGVDGDYVNRSILEVTTDKFVAKDLTANWSLNRKFDLVLSLEVAEHLPEASADLFVKSLINHAKEVIIFSAAIPSQGGQNHLNEQWPEYWQLKFEKYGFYFHDSIRPLIWENKKIHWWYRQNIFLLSREKPQKPCCLTSVHPEHFIQKMNDHKEYTISLQEGKQGLKVSSKIFFNSIKYKVKTLFAI